jgi:amidase
VLWAIEDARRLTGPQLGRAEVTRTTLYHRLREFLEKYEFLVQPTVQVLPFDVRLDLPREVAGVPVTVPTDWIRSTSCLSLVGNPVLAVPAGFAPGGLPVGLQIVGRHHDDRGVLQLGHAFEGATGFGRRRPPVV